MSAAMTCPICSRKALRIASTWAFDNEPSTWECESTMELLGLDHVQSSLLACPRCWHMFRTPLYNEAPLYGPEGPKVRKKAYEKYFPSKNYTAITPLYLRKIGDILRSAAHMLDFHCGPLGATFKVLDYGSGDDGYLGKTIAHAASALTSSDAEVVSYNFQQSSEPKEGYFDLIVLSHVLEHVADPIALLTKVRRHLSEHGRILIAVPFESHAWLYRRSAYLNYHQHAFSPRSLKRAMKAAGLNGSVKLRKASYRGQMMWQIFAAGELKRWIPCMCAGDNCYYPLLHYVTRSFRLEVKAMERLPVKSSLIASVGYDADKNVLEVEFVHENRVYRYDNVHSGLYMQMMNAESVGTWFTANIKKNPELYPCKRVA